MYRSASSHEDQAVNIPLQGISTRRSQRSTDLRDLFDRYDVNGNGHISLCEFRNLITSENYSQDLPEVAVQRILRRADIDQNGHLDYTEFKDMVQSPEWRHTLQNAFSQYVKFSIPPRPVSIDVTDSGAERSVYESYYKLWPPPLGMFIISVIEIATFVTDKITVDTVMADGPVAVKLLYTPYRRFEAWRFFTYMFVHVGVHHLVANLLVQLLLGLPLEMVQRWWRVLIVYMAGVVAGSLGTSVFDPYTHLAGASGGVYAILMAHIATIIMNWSEMKLAACQLAFFVVVIIVDAGSAIYAYYSTDNDHLIGYEAHIAGALAGLLLGINVLRNVRVTSCEKKLWWISISVYLILTLGAVMWNIFYKDYFPISDNY